MVTPRKGLVGVRTELPCSGCSTRSKRGPKRRIKKRGVRNRTEKDLWLRQGVRLCGAVEIGRFNEGGKSDQRKKEAKKQRSRIGDRFKEEWNTASQIKEVIEKAAGSEGRRMGRRNSVWSGTEHNTQKEEPHDRTSYFLIGVVVCVAKENLEKRARKKRARYGIKKKSAPCPRAIAISGKGEGP